VDINRRSSEKFHQDLFYIEKAIQFDFISICLQLPSANTTAGSKNHPNSAQLKDQRVYDRNQSLLK